MISRFFPGVRDVLAEIDEEIVRGALGFPTLGKAQCFEDQYISTGGQLYELMAGHDRFVADLRPLMQKIMNERGLDLSICCHPYDLCTELIARELGIVVTDGVGNAPNYPLSLWKIMSRGSAMRTNKFALKSNRFYKQHYEKRGLTSSLPASVG